MLSPLPQGCHEIASRMRTPLLNVSRRPMELEFLSIVFALFFAYEPFNSLFSKKNISCPKTISSENMNKLNASINSNSTQEENNLPDMATVFQGFQSDLTQPIAASKSQREAFNSLKDDPLIQPDPDEEEELTARIVHPTYST